MTNINSNDVLNNLRNIVNAQSFENVPNQLAEKVLPVIEIREPTPCDFVRSVKTTGNVETLYTVPVGVKTYLTGIFMNSSVFEANIAEAAMSVTFVQDGTTQTIELTNTGSTNNCSNNSMSVYFRNGILLDQGSLVTMYVDTTSEGSATITGFKK
jgi:hypothetical protein